MKPQGDTAEQDPEVDNRIKRLLNMIASESGSADHPPPTREMFLLALLRAAEVNPRVLDAVRIELLRLELE